MITTKEIKSRFERTYGGAFQYIVATKGSEGGGMYPLIDKDGKPLLADVDNQTPFD